MCDDPKICAEVGRLIDGPATRERDEFRDRAAYLYVTGAFPSHLRVTFTRYLRCVSTYSSRSTSLDRRCGVMRLDPAKAIRLDLERHPMVVKTRELIAKGYRIQLSRGANTRQNFGKIFVFRGSEQLTVKIDGAIKDNWS